MKSHFMSLVSLLNYVIISLACMVAYFIKWLL